MFEELDLKITEATANKEGFIILPPTRTINTSRAICSETSTKLCC